MDAFITAMLSLITENIGAAFFSIENSKYLKSESWEVSAET